MAKTGRNFRPTKLQRKLVWALSVGKFPQDQIAAQLGIDPKTLRKCFPQELDTARLSMVAESILVLQKHLAKGDRTTAMFTLKTLAGWRDQGPTEESHRWNLEELDAQIAYLERKLGFKPGEVIPDDASAGEGAKAQATTKH